MSLDILTQKCYIGAMELRITMLLVWLVLIHLIYKYYKKEQ